jgi:hypothetical protein
MDIPSFRCGWKTMVIVEYRHLEMYQQYPIFLVISEALKLTENVLEMEYMFNFCL